MEKAFEPGADPALTLANQGIKSEHHNTALTTYEEELESLGNVSSVRRQEQDLIDSMIHGKEHGHYFLVMGPKVSPRTPPLNNLRCSDHVFPQLRA